MYYDCIFRRVPLGLKLRQDLKITGFNKSEFQKQCLGADAIKSGDFIVKVNRRAVRDVRSLSSLKLTPPIRIRFLRAKKRLKKIIEENRVVLYVPIMTSPLGLCLGKDGRIVGFNKDWQRHRVRDYVNVDDIVLGINRESFKNLENMRNVMRKIKPPYRVRILSNRVQRLEIKNGFVDSSRKIHFVFPHPSSLGTLNHIPQRSRYYSLRVTVHSRITNILRITHRMLRNT